MTKRRQTAKPARIEYLKVQNYRALRSIELSDITPLTVLLGPNGSGKSTVFDVFNFLSECFQFGLRHAWDRRGRVKELRTRGQIGPVTIELKYREKPQMLLNSLRPKEVRVLYRDELGYTQSRRAVDIPGIF